MPTSLPSSSFPRRSFVYLLSRSPECLCLEVWVGVTLGFSPIDFGKFSFPPTWWCLELLNSELRWLHPCKIEKRGLEKALLPRELKMEGLTSTVIPILWPTWWPGLEKLFSMEFIAGEAMEEEAHFRNHSLSTHFRRADIDSGKGGHYNLREV